ncbi:PIN domain-containing protein [Caballeronia sp. GAWG2-1]|uniref:PIN domain-containing protein n=1 Tax=Caballeronia sp. GAWG2-1 TaxID=2921744 RepID=UPI002027F98E|nr:PIN domain-containing protein [Caballeronia sp. GAWG2-1]
MSGYLLDTNIISDLFRNPSEHCTSRIEQIGPKSICTNTVAVAELRYGCAKKGSAKLLSKVEALLGTIQCCPWTLRLIQSTAEFVPDWKPSGEPAPGKDRRVFITASLDQKHSYQDNHTYLDRRLFCKDRTSRPRILQSDAAGSKWPRSRQSRRLFTWYARGLVRPAQWSVSAEQINNGFGSSRPLSAGPPSRETGIGTAPFLLMAAA